MSLDCRRDDGVDARCVSGPGRASGSDRDVGLTCDTADAVALELRRLVRQDEGL